jgi:hypothetical protein
VKAWWLVLVSGRELRRWRHRAVLVLALDLVLWGYLLVSWGWPS